MDWGSVHRIAVEVELWTSLAINLWLIGGAVAFLIRAHNNIKPPSQQVSDALGTSLFAISLFSFWGALITLFIKVASVVFGDGSWSWATFSICVVLIAGAFAINWLLPKLWFWHR